MTRFIFALLLATAALMSVNPAFAQAPAAPAQGPGGGAPQFVSPDVGGDRRVTFRLYAPQAQAVRLNATDIPGVGPASPMTRGDNGVWEIVAGPVPPSAYRYAFNVDAVATLDPRNTRVPTAGPIADPSNDPFVSDFVTAVMPHVQKSYRTMSGRTNTAIAGLSMGGSQTLNIAFAHLSSFGYIGVYSSGLFGVFPIAGRGGSQPAGSPGASEWESSHAAALDDAALKKGLKVFWFSTGSEDFLLNTTIATVEFFKKHGFNPVYEQSAGGHTWLNWRDYLTEFAPKLFQ